ncbi:MAG: TlpA family protein disulfide reductase [Candidatus Scalinduaceae bacterium]
MKAIVRMFLILSLSTFVMFLYEYGVSENILFAETNTGVAVGQKVATFELLTIDDEKLELESFRKDKVVLLVFSATWCPACRHEIPLLKEYYGEYKDDGLEILNIDIQESKKKVGSFVEKNKINYPVVLDSIAKAAMLYEVRGIPLNIILDKDGIIKYRENIPPSKEILEKLLVN